MMTKKAYNRRRFLAFLAALPGGAAILAACGEADNQSLTSNPAAASEQLSAGAVGATTPAPARAVGTPSKLPRRGQAQEFKNEIWINSEPLRLESLRGKVVLMEFWTFGCYNCQNVIPGLRNWWSEFADQGLVIIGMHAPEFDYEKKLENVQEAVKKAGIKYPVAQDNDFTTWNKYQVRAWPSMFLIDKQGIIRYSHIGEGEYEATRTAIISLLGE